MKYCKYCGCQMEDGVAYCPTCGQAAEYSVMDTMEDPTVDTSDPMIKKPESGFFKNAEPKVKALAWIIFLLIFLPGGYFGLNLIMEAEDTVALGVFIIIAALIVGYLSAIILYAFGELCENVSIIANIQMWTPKNKK